MRHSNALHSSSSHASSNQLLVPCIVLIILQLVLSEHISFFGATPHFLLVILALFGLIGGPVSGCIAGFVCGLFLDMLGAGPIGFSALLGCVIGYGIGRIGPDRVDSWQKASWIFLIALTIYHVVYLLLLLMLGSNIAVEGSVFVHIVASIVLDALIGVITFIAVYGLSSSAHLSSSRLR